MTVLVAVPPSVASRHLPLKGGDWTAHAASRGDLNALSARIANGGRRWRGALPISPLEGEMSARLTEGGESHEYGMTGGHAHVH